MDEHTEKAKQELEEERELKKKVKKETEKDAELFAERHDIMTENVPEEIGNISSEESVVGLDGIVAHDKEKVKKLIELSKHITTDKPYRCKTLKSLNSVINGKTADELLSMIESGELTFDSKKYAFEKNNATVSGVYGRMTMNRKIELRKMIHAGQLEITTSTKMLQNLDEIVEETGAYVIRVDIGSREMYLTQREVRENKPSTVYTFTFGIPNEDGEDETMRWCISKAGEYLTENIAERKDKNFRAAMENVGFSDLF